jgi:hypothetical protein
LKYPTYNIHIIYITYHVKQLSKNLSNWIDPNQCLSGSDKIIASIIYNDKNTWIRIKEKKYKG